jgi:hypothetical protein
VIVPDRCVPLLREQRTSYRDIPQEYADEMRRTYDSFAHVLPGRAERILDIGCGMAGIDVHLSDHYGHDVEIILADKEGVSPTILCGFAKSGDWFSYYHDFGAALELLDVNGVPRASVRTVDLLQEPMPDEPVDVAISLLSWGFHYPISEYHPNVRPGGVIIVDVRKNTGGVDLLAQRGEIQIVHESQKYERAVCHI